MKALARALTRGPSLRWHLGRLRTRLMRPAFGEIGPGTVIVRPFVLRGTERITIGAGCAVYEDVWLQCEGAGRIDIGDRSYLGHGVHVHAVDPVRIGSGCYLTDGVLVASGDHERRDRQGVVGTGPISIGDDVFLGQRVVVFGGVTIGDGATVGAHAVVTRDVAPGEVVVGVPARPLAEVKR